VLHRAGQFAGTAPETLLDIDQDLFQAVDPLSWEK